MSASEAATRTSARRTLRVLYIEDSPHDAKLCLRQLEQAGYELSARLVTSREEFEEDLRTQPYDVILADYRTPNWSAMEALEALKQVDKDLPFIIVTGTLGDEGAVECIKRGATDYVLKDRPARLPQAVERALKEKAAREEHQRVEASRKLLASIVGILRGRHRLQGQGREYPQLEPGRGEDVWLLGGGGHRPAHLHAGPARMRP